MECHGGLTSPQPGLVPGVIILRLITALVQVSNSNFHYDVFLLYTCHLTFLFVLGLSQRVIVTNAATGHHQTFNTNSDVLAQQFATQVGEAISLIYIYSPELNTGRTQ